MRRTEKHLINIMFSRKIGNKGKGRPKNRWRDRLHDTVGCSVAHDFLEYEPNQDEGNARGLEKRHCAKPK